MFFNITTGEIILARAGSLAPEFLERNQNSIIFELVQPGSSSERMPSDDSIAAKLGLIIQKCVSLEEIEQIDPDGNIRRSLGMQYGKNGLAIGVESDVVISVESFKILAEIVHDNPDGGELSKFFFPEELELMMKSLETAMTTVTNAVTPTVS